MRDDQRRAVDVFDDVRHRERLAAPRHAHQYLRADSVQHPFRQFLYRLRLIARRLKGGMKLKFHNSSSVAGDLALLMLLFPKQRPIAILYEHSFVL